MRRLGEGRVDRVGVAVVIVERDVARHVVVEERRAVAHRLVGRDHRGKRLDVDLDRFGRVLGGQHRLGDDAGDRVADIAHLVRWPAPRAAASSSASRRGS